MYITKGNSWYQPLQQFQVLHLSKNTPLYLDLSSPFERNPREKETIIIIITIMEIQKK